MYIIIRREDYGSRMKKSVLTILSMLIILSSTSVIAKPAVSSELSEAIKLYKTHNYTQCYVKLEDVIKSDPSNALAYYYMAMTYVQLGNKNSAIENYEKAIALAPKNTNLSKYARKGKICLEIPDKCSISLYDSPEEAFIRGAGSKKFTDEVRSDYERLKIENMMREINRSDDISPQQFREFKDFSSMNNETAPSNDEIVAAMRTLQRAGFGNMINNNYSDISLLTGENSQQNAMLNMMGINSLSPQVIQAMLTNNMSMGF